MKDYIKERAVAIANYIVPTVWSTLTPPWPPRPGWFWMLINRNAISGAAWLPGRSTSTGCRSAAKIKTKRLSDVHDN